MKVVKFLFLFSCIFCFLMLICFNSCTTSKNAITANSPAPGEVEVNIPCSQIKSDKEFFRTNQSATSQDMSMARDKALLNAKTRLASQIESKIKNVMMSYRNEITAGGAQEYSDKIEGEARDITNQSLQDINVVCEKVTKATDGRFNCYIAIEMKKNMISQKINERVTKDDRLKVMYDEKKFREIFDKEMENP